MKFVESSTAPGQPSSARASFSVRCRCPGAAPTPKQSPALHHNFPQPTARPGTVATNVPAAGFSAAAQDPGRISPAAPKVAEKPSSHELPLSLWDDAAPG